MLGTIVAEVKRTRPVAFFLAGNDQNTTLDGATIDREPLKNFNLPYIAREGESPYTELRVFNPSADAPVNLKIKVRKASGELNVPEKNFAIYQRETLVYRLSDADLSGLAGGYIEATASENVFAIEVFGNNAELNMANAQEISSEQQYWIPHFAVGGGYETELDLIEMDMELKAPAQLEITAFDDDGNLFSGTGTVAINLKALEQKTINVASLFGMNTSQLRVGSILVKVIPQSTNPFQFFVPSIAGAVRFRSVGTGFSAVLL